MNHQDKQQDRPSDRHHDRHAGGPDRFDSSNRSSKQIEREIDDTRARIEANSQLLQDRISPSQWIDRTVEHLKDSGASDFFRGLGRSIRDNPLPVMLTSAGVAWLMASSQDRDGNGHGAPSRDFDEDDGRSIADSVGDKASAVADGARDLAGAVRSKASSAGERAKSGLHQGRAGLARGGRRARQGAGDGVDRVQRGVSRLIEEQPLLIGLFGLALGAAMGAALPSTETEDDWVGETSDDLKASAAEKGRAGIEQAREATHQALENASEKVSHAIAPASSTTSPASD